MKFINTKIPEQIRHDETFSRKNGNLCISFTLYMGLNFAIDWTQRTIKDGYKGRRGSLQREIIKNGGALIATPQEIENWIAAKQKRAAKIKTEPDANKKIIWAVDKTSIVPIR